MKIKNKIIAILIIICCSIMVGNPVITTTAAQQSTNTTRLSGQTRYETAKAIAESYSQGKVKSVILSTGNGFADALSASVLAHQKDAPILLVDSSVDGSKDAYDYITQHLNPTGTVYIIGGTGIIGKDFETKLNNLGFNNIVRIAGKDRYKTSYQLANSLDNSSIDTVVISSGESYPDALSIASFAANKGWPILLTAQNTLSDEMKNYLAEKKPTKVYITGGSGVISDTVSASISLILPQASVERLSGQSRFDTNALIAQTFASKPATVYLATGYGFADALAGSALAAKNGDPIVFIDPSIPTLPKTVAAYFAKLNTGNQYAQITVFGGSGVVSDEVLNNAGDLISGKVKEDSIYKIDDIKETVILGQKYTLPETVKAKLYNSEIFEVKVNWNINTVDTNTAGLSTYEGTVAEYSKLTVKLTLNVVQEDDGSRARVKINGKYGYINKSGKVVFYDNYGGPVYFCEGLKSIELNSKYGFINTSGEIVVPTIYDLCGDFHDGLAAVIMGNPQSTSCKVGYIDKTGKVVIPIKYNYFGGVRNYSDFSEGMAMVSENKLLGGKKGFINNEGNLVTPYKYIWCDDFHEGLAAVSIGYKKGFIDKNGNEVVPIKYDSASMFSEGYAAVELNNKWGYIDKTGREVIPLIYDFASPFQEGLAVVKMNNKYGYINKTGEVVIPFKYDYPPGLFHEDIAIVHKYLNNEEHPKYGYIDKTGKEITPIKYAYCGEFNDGVAICILNAKGYGGAFGSVAYGLTGVIDKSGKIIVPFLYEEISGFHEGLACVATANGYDGVPRKFGFINTKGQEVIPLIFDGAYYFFSK